MHHMTLVSFRLFRKNLGNLREFLGKWFIAQMIYAGFMEVAPGKLQTGRVKQKISPGNGE